MHLVDIWNVIEAFREHSLNTMEIEAELNISRLESLISSLYQTLNKRLPTAQQIHIEMSSTMLLNWLLNAYSEYVCNFFFYITVNFYEKGEAE